MGHPYRGSDGESYGVELDSTKAARALTESLEIEAQISTAAQRAISAGLVETDSPYSPFEAVAQELGYTGDPTLEPSPFFTTLHGYRELYQG